MIVEKSAFDIDPNETSSDANASASGSAPATSGVKGKQRRGGRTVGQGQRGRCGKKGGDYAARHGSKCGN
jgi:hypothetical protein